MKNRRRNRASLRVIQTTVECARGAYDGDNAPPNRIFHRRRRRRVKRPDSLATSPTSRVFLRETMRARPVYAPAAVRAAGHVPGRFSRRTRRQPFFRRDSDNGRRPRPPS